MTTPITRPVSSILLQEILGFAPELLLDDIVDSANNSIYQCVNAMEPFLRRWMEQRPLEPPPDEPDWSPEAEIEQGLVAFQTLLENHVDIAFDFFDVWCRRNVFTFNPDLPIVVPHQQDLDLSLEPERETELLTDIEELRRAIDNQRRVRRCLQRARPVAAAAASRSKKRLETLSFLRPLLDNDITNLPVQLNALHNSVQALPQMPLPVSNYDPRKRPWESSQEGYLHWAVQKLVDRARTERRSSGAPSYLSSLSEGTQAIGSFEDIKSAAAAAATNPSVNGLEGS